MKPKVLVTHKLLTEAMEYLDKHVVYTRFRKSHGLDLIDTLLNYLGILHTVITDDNNRNEQIGKISTFCSETDQKVLIMNTLPKAEINDISHVHFLEGVDEDTMSAFIHSVYKARLFTKTMPLSCSIHFHISSIQSGKETISIDGGMYTELANSVINKQEVYDDLISKSRKICYIRGKGICIE